jgi:hypothetical protein
VPQTESSTTGQRAREALLQQRLHFERQRLALDIRLKRRQLQTPRKTDFRNLFANPIALAIVGGFLTLITSIVSNALSMRASREADARTLQSELIKTFVKTADQATARQNLSFLIDAGLLPDYQSRIGGYLKKNPSVAPRLTDTVAARNYSPCPTLWNSPRSTDAKGVAKISLSLHLGLNRVDKEHYDGMDLLLLGAEADAVTMSGMTGACSCAIKEGPNV